MTAKYIIGVPEKGRNAGTALREELPGEYDKDYILDVLNGVGKMYAKTGLNRHWIERAVVKLDCVDFKDTGRAFNRPVFTETGFGDVKIQSFDQNPLAFNPDRFYQGFDWLVEGNYTADEIDRPFEELIEETAEEKGYRLEEAYGDEVKWGVMNTDLNVVPETVLLPDEFQSVGKTAAERYWDSDPDYISFSDFADFGEEEELLAEIPKEVAGVYMFVSGSSAEDVGLDYEAVEGMTSRLGRFERTQNQYKNSDKSPI